MRVGIAQIAAPLDPARAAVVATAAIDACADDGADLVVLPEYASAFDPRGVGPADAQELDGAFLTAVRGAAQARRVHVLAGVTLAPGRETRPGAGPGADAVSGAHSGACLSADSGTCLSADSGTGRSAGSGTDRSAGSGAPPDAPARVAASVGARASNAVVHVGPDGTLGRDYRKVHLFDAFGQRESERFAPGDPGAEPLVIDVDGLRVGVLTCYDLRFPESARRLVDAGAEVIVVPAAWAAGPGKAEQWTVLARARALENLAWVVAVGMAGRGVCGTSLVVDPSGKVAHRLGLGPATAVVDIDRGRVADARARIPALDHRRYDVVPRQEPSRER